MGIARFVYHRMVAHEQARRDTGLWLTPHELEKEFNAVKQANPSLAFVTEVSKFVAQGACRNYRNARSRWLNKNLKARRPVFYKKRRTGTGSFLAASGIPTVRYDGHRRIRLPYLGSVRMTRPLPEGIPYEVTIRKRTGRWYASIAYWKAPIAPPRRETPIRGRCGRGHQSPGRGQQRSEVPEPQAVLPSTTSPATLATRTGSPDTREPGLVGSPGRIDRAHRRVLGLRNNAHHHVSRALVREYHTLGIETLNVSGLIKTGLSGK